MTRLDGYTLQLTAPPPQPIIGFTYSAGSLSRSGSATFTSSKSLKRKRSDEAMTVSITVSNTAPNPEAPLILPIVFPSVNGNTEGSYASPASPAPTEIVDFDDRTGEEHMENAKAAGVKVRDFAYEPLPKERDVRAPEFWSTPREALVLHDRYIRAAPYRALNYRLSGKLLHNLLKIGWVTQEEAEFHWRDEDWKAMNEYMCRPLGPYPVCIPKGTKKPTAAYRARMRKEKFLVMPDDISEDKIYVPPDEPDMDDGPSCVEPSLFRAAADALSRALSYTTPATSTISPAPVQSNGDPDASHANKKRRVSAGSDAAITPQSTPPATPVPTEGRTLSRSASLSASVPSRPSTPPARNDPPALSRGRGRGGLMRTQTFDVIA
ncbi:hypothetical protein GY45DRAFT_1331755 [Cubamyces sp. BRFM 1775]|nr:hypothetical protein GY45DRAFT_1331755 [Cubamyces sp. BRFM 1775]